MISYLMLFLTTVWYVFNPRETRVADGHDEVVVRIHPYEQQVWVPPKRLKIRRLPDDEL
jgi:hypothetical protein